MADPQSERESAKATDPVQRAGRIGRRIAGAIYLVGLVYITVVGFVSVIPQAFWPSPANADVEPPSGDCATALRTLRDDVLAETGRRTGRRLPDPLEPFLQEWDDRYLALSARCGEHDGYTRVNTLRHRLETTMRRFEREDGALIQSVDQVLGHENTP